MQEVLNLGDNYALLELALYLLDHTGTSEEHRPASLRAIIRRKARPRRGARCCPVRAQICASRACKSRFTSRRRQVRQNRVRERGQTGICERVVLRLLDHDLIAERGVERVGVGWLAGVADVDDSERLAGCTGG